MEEIQELNDSLQMVPIDKQLEWLAQIEQIKDKILVEEVDYGVYVGNKPSLSKSGAEKFVKAFNLHPNIKTRWDTLDNGHKDFFSTCTLMFNSGNVLCSAEGSCSTQENKFKSQPQEKYNTCLKMSAKRALIASVLIGLGLSGLFTQDTEDMPRQTNNANNGNRSQGNQTNGTVPNGSGSFQNEVCPLCGAKALGKSQYSTGSEYYCYPKSNGCGKGVNANQLGKSPKDQAMDGDTRKPDNVLDYQDSEQAPVVEPPEPDNADIPF